MKNIYNISNLADVHARIINSSKTVSKQLQQDYLLQTLRSFPDNSERSVRNVLKLLHENIDMQSPIANIKVFKMNSKELFSIKILTRKLQ